MNLDVDSLKNLVNSMNALWNDYDVRYAKEREEYIRKHFNYDMLSSCLYAAKNIFCPIDILEKLSGHDNVEVVALVAGHGRTPVDTLQTIYNRYSDEPIVLLQLATNPSLPQEILTTLMQTGDREMLIQLAYNSSLSPEFVDALVRLNDPQIIKPLNMMHSLSVEQVDWIFEQDTKCLRTKNCDSPTCIILKGRKSTVSLNVVNALLIFIQKEFDNTIVKHGNLYDRMNRDDALRKYTELIADTVEYFDMIARYSSRNEAAVRMVVDVIERYVTSKKLDYKILHASLSELVNSSNESPELELFLLEKHQLFLGKDAPLITSLKAGTTIEQGDYARAAEWWLYRDLAGRTRHPEVCRVLVQYNIMQVLKSLAEKQDAPDDVLETLFQYNANDIYTSLAQNSGLKLEMAERLLALKIPQVNAELAKNTHMDIGIFRKLYKQHDTRVNENLAGNYCVPLDILLELSSLNQYNNELIRNNSFPTEIKMTHTFLSHVNDEQRVTAFFNGIVLRALELQGEEYIRGFLNQVVFSNITAPFGRGLLNSNIAPYLTDEERVMLKLYLNV